MRIPLSGLLIAAVVAVGGGLAPGCNCSSTNGGNGTDLTAGGGDDFSVGGDLSGTADDLSVSTDFSSQGDLSSGPGNTCTPPSSITITPGNMTAMVTPGTAFTQTFTATAHYPGGATANITAFAFFTLSDPTVGTFSGATFTWGGDHGGAITVTAKTCGVAGTTMLTLDLATTIGTGTVNPSTASMMFNNAGMSTNASCAPVLVYPPDAVLLPPNTNVIEVHFTFGSATNNLFEISFENALTDVKVYTTCTGATPADGMPLNGGCIFELNQNEWDYVALTNRAGGPVTVKVRALGCDPGKAASSATRNISFAQDDMIGTLYYWASLRAGSVAYNSGGVYRYDFGVRGQTADPVLTPTTTNNPGGWCIGCHTISRDGRQMLFDYDDNDSDDEYGDISTDVLDIAKNSGLVPFINKGQAFKPGYHTWNRGTTAFLLSDGEDQNNPKGALYLVTPNWATSTATVAAVQPGTLRATTPDWAPDDQHVVFSVPSSFQCTNSNMTGANCQDLFFTGASLYVAPWNSVTKNFGTAASILTPTGTGNYYYPSYSPDGSLIAFNYAPSGANFHNPAARVQLVPSGQAAPTPDDLANLNTASTTATNSWARWSPFVQNYNGQKLLWITFSSTRDYGLRMSNTGAINCYPCESPTGYPMIPNTNKCTGTTTPCSRTQLWIAAVKLDTNAVMNGTDVSFPAFWLPFQDMTTNNHLAQWAQQSFSGTCSMDSDCNPGGADAGAGGRCCYNGGCATCLSPPPPAPQCTVNGNCAPGQCCQSGACVSCPDGGTPPAPDAGPGGCNTCLDCNGQACVAGMCGSCTDDTQCCAPLFCAGGVCVPPVM